MARELKPLEIDEIPELQRVVRAVQDSGEPCVLTQAGAKVAVITPVAIARRRQGKRGAVTREDSLWSIVGMASSDGPGDVARNKHRYLAEAYADQHR